jgi:hypothetical protein
MAVVFFLKENIIMHSLLEMQKNTFFQWNFIQKQIIFSFFLV